ncbi:hypothetical protein MKX03_010990 [Papaver bracteatum]|nr:hypothetical protein MKX03_010990 [Papaver bracteatum]
MSMSMDTVMQNAKILDDDKKKSDLTMSGTRMNTQPNFHQFDIHMILYMETERKKKANSKSWEDGFESEKNDGIAISIKVTMKKDSIRKSDV